jgi:guanine deaminase
VSSSKLIRATVFHTHRNPFVQSDALEICESLLIADGKISAAGAFTDLRRANPEAEIVDWRDGFVIPGLVDTHVHFPQVRVIGSLGRTLLDWLEECALPEELRMADASYAAAIARTFVHGLVSHGTTTAMVFGSHFSEATAMLFESAHKTGLRVASGLILSDRVLPNELLQTPRAAYEESAALIRKWHGAGRLLYAITPRFALSASEAMLEVCQSLKSEFPQVLFQTHLNENHEEIAAVARRFPWAPDYLGVYERYDLCGPLSVMAHSVHSTDVELERMAASGTSVSHCPCSNAALGSGIFPLHRHLSAGVRCALGTDVGGGTGFGVLKEGLQAYLMQRVATDGVMLSAAHLLYLATKAGAKAMGLGNQIGDFVPGKAADLVYVRPVPGSALASIAETGDPQRILSALFTLGDAACVHEVLIDGEPVFRHEAC